MFFETGVLAGWPPSPMFLMPFGLKCKKKKDGIGGVVGMSLNIPPITYLLFGQS